VREKDINREMTSNSEINPYRDVLIFMWHLLQIYNVRGGFLSFSFLATNDGNVKTGFIISENLLIAYLN